MNPWEAWGKLSAVIFGGIIIAVILLTISGAITLEYIP